MRLQLKGHCIFGTFLGYKDKSRKLVLFLDEETGEIKTYPKSRLQPTYEKLL